jgi:hypothetical protein
MKVKRIPCGFIAGRLVGWDMTRADVFTILHAACIKVGGVHDVGCKVE